MPFDASRWQLFGSFDSVLVPDATADGWVVDLPAYPADWSVKGVGHIQSLYNAFNADPGQGTAVIEAYALWWDHYQSYVTDRFGTGRAVVIGGFSMGAWVSAIIALNAASSAPVGVFCHALPTIWENIAVGEGLPAPTAAGDLGPHAFDNISIPAIIGYSNTDNVVGWNLSGAPNGTIGSNVDSIITNAQAAGAPMTRYESIADETNTGPGTPTFALGGGHLFTPQDAQIYANPTSNPAGVTTPALSAGWLQTFIDPLVPPNTF
jgi:hypothetical protein